MAVKAKTLDKTECQRRWRDRKWCADVLDAARAYSGEIMTFRLEEGPNGAPHMNWNMDKAPVTTCFLTGYALGRRMTLDDLLQRWTFALMDPANVRRAVARLKELSHDD